MGAYYGYQVVNKENKINYYLAVTVKDENNFYKLKFEEGRDALQTGVDLIY